MKKLLWFSAFLLFSLNVRAQDEGTIIKRERISRDNNVFLSFGPSFTLGKNIGDYSAGFNIEIGYLKRLNRVLSIGPSLSYVNFEYDPEVTSVDGGDAYVGEGDPNDWAEKYGIPGLSYYYGYILTLEGGNLSMTSLAVNFKLNFVPIKDNTKVSIYGFAKPFVTMVSRSEVSGTEARYTYETFEDTKGTNTIFDDLLYYENGDDTWYPDGYTGTWNGDNYEALQEGNEVTGGIFVGPGIEIMPTKKFSFFTQVAFGYTFPLTFVSTSAYENTVESYLDEKFPMTKKGFPSVSIQFGASFNF